MVLCWTIVAVLVEPDQKLVFRALGYAMTSWCKSSKLRYYIARGILNRKPSPLEDASNVLLACFVEFEEVNCCHAGLS